MFLIGFTICVRVDAQTNSAPSTATSTQVETIVCIRHGEKPPGGLGQLTCRGLNRALALPKVLLAKYGIPQFVFAPNLTQKVDGMDEKQGHFPLRPLMTIEPTAIRCGLPVNIQFGTKEISRLENELQKAAYKSAIVFIAWEHVLLDDFAKNVVKACGGDSTQVPLWPADDYDTIFVIQISRSEGRESAAFTIDHENLDNLSDTCP